VTAVIGSWAAKFDLTFGTALPRLSWGTSNPTTTIVDATGSGLWCGETNDAGTQILMRHSCTTNASDYGTTLTHEIAHVYGLKTTHEKAGVPGVSDHCAIHLPDDGTINGNICQHEIELIYQGWGHGNLPVTDPVAFAAFWGEHIATGFNLPITSTIEEGTSKQFMPTQFQFANGRISGLAVGSASFSWSVSPTPGVELQPNGTVLAQTQGTYTLTVRLLSALPQGYRRGTVFQSRGYPIAITVVPAPGPFRVTAITADQEPAITVGGMHGFTATTTGSPQAGSYAWRFIRSSTPWDTTTVVTTTKSVIYNVWDGSYSLSVRVVPAGGTAFERYVNVCTGSGAALMAPGEEENVVAGCQGGGGGEPL